MSLLVRLTDWNLRDYGTGRWIGGSSSCNHLAPPRGGRNPETAGKQLTNAGTLTYQFARLCSKCGAQRIDEQIGLEGSPEAFVERLVLVMREVRRVLRPEGVAWLNLGDSYNGSGGEHRDGRGQNGLGIKDRGRVGSTIGQKQVSGLKPKDLVGIPWMVAFALRADGWYLRSDIVWSKLNPMPESVTDRPTHSHEYIFLLSKERTYFFDQDALREPYAPASLPRALRGVSEDNKWLAADAPGSGGVSFSQSRPNQRKAWEKSQGGGGSGFDGHSGYVDANGRLLVHPDGRNVRSVWSITTQSYRGAHYATFPEELARRCIVGGTSERGVCPTCGAPWERVKDRVGSFQRRWGIGNKPGSPYADQSNEAIVRRTVGWLPSCGCYGHVIPRLPEIPDEALLPELCNVCGGTGSLPAGPLLPDEFAVCPECRGSGGAPGDALYQEWSEAYAAAEARRLALLDEIDQKSITVPAIVFDPFVGSGTTLLVAKRLGRSGVGVDLKFSYLNRDAKKRVDLQQPMLF